MLLPFRSVIHKLHIGPFGTFKILPYCTSLTSKQAPEENAKFYDYSANGMPFSQKEKDSILKIINDASAEDLMRLKITEDTIVKLMKRKSEVGIFHDISQLCDISGIATKSVENLCTLVLENNEINICTNELPNGDFDGDLHRDDSQDFNIIYKKRLVKPKISPHMRKSVETVVSLHITAGFLAWTKFDHRGKVLDLCSEELLNSSSHFDAPKIYERVAEVVERIPPADLYVWEKQSNYGRLQKAPLGTIIIALQLAQMKGILTAMLNFRHDSKADRLIYVQEALVNKLFKLNVAGERASNLKLADRLMEGRQVIDWLPLLSLERDAQELYFSLDSSIRRYVAISLFIGVAFHHCALQHNQDAIRALK